MAKKTEGKTPTLKVGEAVKITDESHEYFGAIGAIREIKYASPQDAADARSGEPDLALYAKVGSILIRTRGGNHALVSLTPDQVERTTMSTAISEY